MRKYFSLILALALMVLPFMPVVKAGGEQDLYAYVVSNATASAAETNVSTTTTIIPGKIRILGFTVGPITSGTGTIGVGLYDTTTISGTTGLFGEGSCANTTTDTQWFPYPKPLSSGLSVFLGPYSTVVIYYEKYIP